MSEIVLKAVSTEASEVMSSSTLRTSGVLLVECMAASVTAREERERAVMIKVAAEALARARAIPWRG